MIPKPTEIQTRDGLATVEWWELKDFKGRVTKIISSTEITAIPIPDTVVLCDFCNIRITVFPVPVVWQRALCPKCFKWIEHEEEKD